MAAQLAAGKVGIIVERRAELVANLARQLRKRRRILADMRQTLPAIAVLTILGGGVAWAQTDPDKMPARDAHQNIVIAVDAYHTETRAKEKFGKKNPLEAGILAIEVVMRNDNDKAVKVDLESISLLLAVPGQSRQRLVPLTLEEVLGRVLYKGGRDSTKQRRPLPGRLPGAPKPPKDWQELEEKWRPLVFEMDILPPKSVARGVMFFDLNHHFDWLPYTRFYVPDLAFEQGGQALLFFEVDLAAIVR